MKVLYVNHTSTMSGAELSLLSLLRGLDGHVDAVVACPAGPLAQVVDAEGIGRVELPAVDGSLKLSLRDTPRALRDMARASLTVRRAVQRGGFDLLHANSIRSGLITAPLRTPSVVHVRDCLPAGRVSSAVSRCIGRSASAVLCNSGYTRDRFARPGFRAAVEVVHNPVDLDRFDPDRVQPVPRAELGIREGALVLTVLAQLTPWKGQDDAIRALATLRALGHDAQLLLIGSPKFVTRATRHDNIAYLRALHRMVVELGLDGDVVFAGERTDVPELLASTDLLLMPSWEEPFGRAAIEALAMGVPVVATEVGGPAEVIADGEDGVLLPPRCPERWGGALADLACDPDRRARMSAAARRSSGRFAVEAHAAAVMSAYARALGAERAEPAADAPRDSALVG